MASNVVVLLPDGRRQTVKTTPMMTLKQIVNVVCEKQKMEDVEKWGLKQNKTTLDLSLSVRFANLAPGAKLDLIRITVQKVHSDVQVALQVEEGGRMIEKFPITTSLWDMLIRFENLSQDGSLSLTRRTAPASKKKGIFKNIGGQSKDLLFYQQPVCLLLNKEYGTIPILKSTTLQSTGITSGNIVLRLLFRSTELSLDDVLNDIITPFQAPNNDVPVAGSSIIPSESNDEPKKVGVEQSNSEIGSSIVPVESIDEPSKINVTAPTKSIEGIEQSDHSPHSSTVPESTDEHLKMGVEQNVEPMEVDSNLPDQVSTTASNNDDDVIKSPLERIDMLEKPGEKRQTSENYHRSEVIHSPVTQTEADPVNQSSDRGHFDRNVKVFNPPPENVQFLNQIDLPDSFYELTGAELKFLLAMQNSKRVSQENVGFKTSKIRAQEEKEKERKYPKTLIRVKFPDGLQLQIAFMSKETVAKLYELVKEALLTPDRTFELYTSPPKKVLSDQNLSFYHAELSPASVVYFIWTDKSNDDSGTYLSEEYLKLREDIPHPQTTEDVNTLVIPENSTIKPEGTGHTLSEPSSSHQQGEGSNNKKKDKGPGSKRSMPKWFRKK